MRSLPTRQTELDKALGAAFEGPLDPRFGRAMSCARTAGQLTPLELRLRRRRGEQDRFVFAYIALLG